MIGGLADNSDPLAAVADRIPHSPGTGRERHRYTAYGLQITSDLELPELRPGTAAAELVVRVGKVEFVPRTGDPIPAFEATEHGIYFRYAGTAAYRIRDGCEVTIDPEPGAREELIRLYLTGPVLATALHQRGLLVLHASGIAVGGGAVGFLGWPRRGKSTIAAVLHGRGHPLVTDDVMAVEFLPAPYVRPGFPQFKLWPETAAYLGQDPIALPRLHPELEKRARRLNSGFESESLPLSRLYVLSDDGSLGVESLSKQQSVIELVRHSYFAERLSALGGAQENFHQCGRLANGVPVRRLQRGTTLPDVSRLAELVESDLASAPASPGSP